MDKIYIASKIWHNKVWRSLNIRVPFFYQIMGNVHVDSPNYKVPEYHIISQWINYPCGTKENPQGAKDLTTVEKMNLWETCIEDIQKCDILVAYAEEGETHRGVLVEIGAALAMNKPVYLIGESQSFREEDGRPAVFTHHPLFNKCGSIGGFSITGYTPVAPIKPPIEYKPITNPKHLWEHPSGITFDEIFLLCIKHSKSKDKKSS